MQSDSIANTVHEIFIEVFPELKDRAFSLDKRQEEFESWDSFSHMELVGKLEERFHINLEMEEVVELNTPQRFIDIVEKKLEK
ncbi:MAG: acyl carrier protein [Candidatus Wildermuthbacteria bacterium]|nr:acyl carrier protein [Candidatus Wildermuthbacteria bacterium]